MRLLLVGDDNDLCAAYFVHVAEKCGHEILTLREQSLGDEWSLVEEIHGPGVMIGDIVLPLASFDGAFVRLNPSPGMPKALQLTSEESALFELERRHALSWLLDNAPFSVVNRPRAGRSNASKPYQMMLLKRAGFSVPKWIISNSRYEVGLFVASVGGAIYKAASGLRCHVRPVDQLFLERLEAGTAAVVVQEYVRGHDVRVHVAGRRTYATAISSQAVDYRFDKDNVQYQPADVPSSIEERCHAFAQTEGLALAGFDFRIDEGGEWHCLEVNPVPTYLPYEVSAGHPIARSIIEYFEAESILGAKQSAGRT